MGSQLWRVLAETVRADYGGRGRFAPYQRFVFTTAALGASCAWLVPSPPAAADRAAGLSSLRSPIPLLTLELFWLPVFFAIGRSTETGSALEFGLLQASPNPLKRERLHPFPSGPYTR